MTEGKKLMKQSVVILAYGSLITEPGSEDR